MEQLTAKEAKEQGYEFFGITDQGFQEMCDINDFNNCRPTGKERLFKKEPDPPFTTNSEMVKDLLVDNLSKEWSDESRDDTGETYDFLNDIPEEKFNDIAAILNEAMANKHYYKLSNIKLVP